MVMILVTITRILDIKTDSNINQFWKLYLIIPAIEIGIFLTAFIIFFCFFYIFCHKRVNNGIK